MDILEYARHVHEFILELENSDSLGSWIKDDTHKIREKRISSERRISKLKAKLKQTTESILDNETNTKGE